jgi:[acyl-carrier-protein] S-malonyltransferase
MAALLGLDEAAAVEACAEAAQGEVVSAANLNSPARSSSPVPALPSGARWLQPRPWRQACGAAAGERSLPLCADEAGCRASAAAPGGHRSACAGDPSAQQCGCGGRDRPARIKDALVRQAYSPVRWIETVQEIARRGATHVFECGPGKVLAGMTKRIEAACRGRRLPMRPASKNSQDDGAA